MIGNDVVDLQTAARESRWQRRGYLEKLFDTSEQEMIHDAKQPEVMLWTLWSMKEAAYKIHSKKTNIRKFAPSKLIGTDLHLNDNEMVGCIRTEGLLYHARTVITEAYVYSIAAPEFDMLTQVYTRLYCHADPSFDYKRTSPACVSHHGVYLALAYFK